jgi:hypothetical protein
VIRPIQPVELSYARNACQGGLENRVAEWRVRVSPVICAPSERASRANEHQKLVFSGQIVPPALNSRISASPVNYQGEVAWPAQRVPGDGRTCSTACVDHLDTRELE